MPLHFRCPIPFFLADEIAGSNLAAKLEEVIKQKAGQEEIMNLLKEFSAESGDELLSVRLSKSHASL